MPNDSAVKGRLVRDRSLVGRPFYRPFGLSIADFLRKGTLGISCYDRAIPRQVLGFIFEPQHFTPGTDHDLVYFVPHVSLRAVGQDLHSSNPGNMCSIIQII